MNMRFQVVKKKNEVANIGNNWFHCLLCPVHYKLCISPGIELEKDINIFVPRTFFYGKPWLRANGNGG